MNEKSNLQDLTVLRSYFSYNIRTAAAVMVASVTVLQLELEKCDSAMADTMLESAYFLDIYDKGMEICFEYAMGNELPISDDKISPAKIITHFIGKIPNLIKEHEISVELDLNDYMITSNAKICKILLETILCEIFNNAHGKISIIAKDDTLQFKLPKEIMNIDAIFTIFRKYLRLLKIDFHTVGTDIKLRFKV